jgi:Spy/CpxP family protein refolding chaperone
MKRMLLTAVVIAASVCTAFAQEQKTNTSTVPIAKETEQKTWEPKQAQEWQNLLVTELKLTDEQQKKIADLNKAFGERRKAIENNADLTDEAKAERKAMLKKAQEAQFNKILTPEQQARYKELVEARSKKD